MITGDGPMLKEIKSISPDNVIFTGYKKGKELAKIYASADIFTFPSVTEIYGNVVIEAMASGLPVIGIMAGGVKENLINLYNGLACSSSDINEFSSKLVELLLNNKLRKNLAYNARQHALSQTWDKVFSKLINSYNKIIYSNQYFIKRSA